MGDAHILCLVHHREIEHHLLGFTMKLLRDISALIIVAELAKVIGRGLRSSSKFLLFVLSPRRLA
jgi:hypothetical protein